jgi:serine/threonine-protein kinase
VALPIGTRFGAAEVIALIGAGGMGEVYRARDTRLHRDVALKILPEAFARDPERVARFKREAHVLASLNHSNIAAIYGFEDANGIQALVLEYVAGPTLADRIALGPIAFEEALPIARQIADALEAAHEHGIVHRDLKPSNIKVVGDGTVKVLDFGLAKALDSPSAALADVTASPTITSPAMTRAGVILGTAAYMAPEQARGRASDKRSDIWAFGCVLYEMLTGKRAFAADDVSETLAAVLRAEPDLNALPAEAERIRPLLRACLQKDPRQRVHDIADVRLALEGVFDGPDRTARSPTSGWKRAMLVATTSAIVGGAIVGVYVWASMRATAISPVRLTIPPPVADWSPPDTGVATVGSDVAISSDGKHVVFVGAGATRARQLYVRALDRLHAQPLLEADGPMAPFVSPDGSSIGFFDNGVMKRSSVNGGPAVTIVRTHAGLGASWGPDDRIVFGTNDVTSGLLRVAASGGDPEVVTTVDASKGELDHWWPDVLPGGEAVLFTILMQSAPSQIAVHNFRTREQKVLIRGGSYPRYVRTGHIVYGAQGKLWAVAFDRTRLEVRGDPVPVVDDVISRPDGSVYFAVAQNGSLAYFAGPSQRVFTLVWVDRKGGEQPVGAPPRLYAQTRISPDGTRLALDVRDQDNSDVWIWDLARATLTRFTSNPAFDRQPIWTSNGQQIVFSSTRAGAANLFSQPADGTRPAQRVTEGPSQHFPTSVTPDGTRVIFFEIANRGIDVAAAPLDGRHRHQSLLETSFVERNAEVSPDGKWLAYQSDESGQTEVYVRPFPDVERGRWNVSAGPGTRPMWAPNGRELFYFVEPRTMMSVSITPGPALTVGKPQRVFEGDYAMPLLSRTYDISPDGQRFVLIKEDKIGSYSARPQLVVVQNWFEELKRLALWN